MFLLHGLLHFVLTIVSPWWQDTLQLLKITNWSRCRIAVGVSIAVTMKLWHFWLYVEQKSSLVGCVAICSPTVHVSVANRYQHQWEAIFKWTSSNRPLVLATRCHLWLAGGGALMMGRWNPEQKMEGPCMVRSNVSGVMITWNPLWIDSQTWLKRLPFRNFVGGR